MANESRLNIKVILIIFLIIIPNNYSNSQKNRTVEYHNKGNGNSVTLSFEDSIIIVENKSIKLMQGDTSFCCQAFFKYSDSIYSMYNPNYYKVDTLTDLKARGLYINSTMESRVYLNKQELAVSRVDDFGFFFDINIAKGEKKKLFIRNSDCEEISISLEFDGNLKHPVLLTLNEDRVECVCKFKDFKIKRNGKVLILNGENYQKKFNIFWWR